MLLIHESQVFELRVETKYEVYYPLISYRNATSVLQRRKPEKKKNNNNNNKTIQSHGNNPLWSDQVFFVKKTLS